MQTCDKKTALHWYFPISHKVGAPANYKLVYKPQKYRYVLYIYIIYILHKP